MARPPRPRPVGRRRRSMATALAVVALLVAAACSSDGGDDGSATSGPTSTAPTADPDAGVEPDQEAAPGDEGVPEGSVPVYLDVAEAPPDVVRRLATLGGRLAVIDGDRLVIVAPDGAGAVTVDDVGRPTQPVWSNRGDRLAWSRTSADGPEVAVADTRGELASSVPLAGAPAFYLQWERDDRALAYLRNAPGPTIEAGIVRPDAAPLDEGGPADPEGDPEGDGSTPGPSTPLAVGAPFYLSWSDGGSLAAHVDGRVVRVVPDAVDGVVDGSAAGPATSLDVVEPSGRFTAPAWIDDDTLLAVVPEGLALVDVGGGFEVLVPVEGEEVQFVLSPDRTRVALQVLSEVGQAPLPVATEPPVAPSVEAALVVLDLATGELIPVSQQTAAAWHWSSDGRSLAWLEAIGSGTWWRWHLWDGEVSVPTAIHEPSATAGLEYLPFFEQYAQSVTGWAPDGSAFAFTGTVDGDDGRSGVWVHLRGPEPATVRVADGDVVTWSP